MFDCCIVNHELDLLEIRMHTLNDVVEKFVIVESNTTHSGKSKKMHFTDNIQRFEKFKDKIIHLVYEGQTFSSEQDGENTHLAWGNENGQRNHVLEALKIAEPKDGILFISDVDEIVKPEKLLEGLDLYNKTGMLVNFALEQCLYYLNYNFKGFKQITGSMLYNMDRAKKIYDSIGYQHHNPSSTRWHMVSEKHGREWPTVNDAGWHFSTLVDLDSIKYKLESNAHVYASTEEYKNFARLQKCIDEGIHLYDMDRYKDTKLVKREIEFVPKYVQENLSKFDKYILK